MHLNYILWWANKHLVPKRRIVVMQKTMFEVGLVASYLSRLH
jgi:hypothetical protein